MPKRLGEMMRILKDEAGVEPTAMKIMAGVILLAIGLGIGVAVYKTVGGAVTAMKVDVSLARSSTTIGRPASGENTDDIRVDITLLMGTAETATLDATGEPSGVTVTFSPPSGKPPFYSTMTISVSNTVGNADLRKHTLTILAKDSGGATSGSAPFDLTIQ
jgi:hypothetical protein